MVDSEAGSAIDGRLKTPRDSLEPRHYSKPRRLVKWRVFRVSGDLVRGLTPCLTPAYLPAPRASSGIPRAGLMKFLTDLLWTLVRWILPLSAAAVVVAVALGSNRIGEEVRRRVEARLQEMIPGLTVRVEAASLVEGEGIVVRGVSFIDAKLPPAARRSGICWQVIHGSHRSVCCALWCMRSAGPTAAGASRLSCPAAAPGSGCQ